MCELIGLTEKPDSTTPFNRSTLIPLLALIFLLSSSSVLADSYKNPWAEYRFENNSLDSSGYGNDATTAGIHYNTTRKVGNYSVQIDADTDEIDTGISLPLDNFSFAGWVRTININQQAGLATTLTNTVGRDGFHLFGSNITGEEFRFKTFIGNVEQISLLCPVNFTADTWAFATITCNATGGTQECRGYVNNMYLGSDTGNVITGNDEDFHIGKKYVAIGGFTNAINGSVDQFVLYNYTLSCEGNPAVNGTCTGGDIYELYNNGSGYICEPNYVNTTWSPWINLTACNISNEQIQQRNRTTYDNNYCYIQTNTSYYENQTASCNYCSPAVNYTGNDTAWSDTPDSCGYRYLQYNDLNWATCCAVTNLSSDCFPGDNSTNKEFHYQLEERDCLGINDTPITLTVFIIIGVIAIIFLLIGMGAQIPFFTIVGFFLILVLGFLIQGGNLLLPAGLNETVNGSTTITTTIYEPWNTGNYHFIGFFVMIAGFFAALFSVFATFGGGND